MKPRTRRIPRINEPSTMAGLAVLASIFGADVAQSQAVAAALASVFGQVDPHSAANTVAGIAAAAAILMPEAKGEPK